MGGISLKGKKHIGMLTKKQVTVIETTPKVKQLFKQVFKNKIMELTKGMPLPEEELKKLTRVAASEAIKEILKKQEKITDEEYVKKFLEKRKKIKITETNKIIINDPEGAEPTPYYAVETRGKILVLNEETPAGLKPRFIMKVDDEFPTIYLLQRLRTRTKNNRWNETKEREAEKELEQKLWGLKPQDVLIMEFILRNKKRLLKRQLETIAIYIPVSKKQLFDRIIKLFFKNPEERNNVIRFELDKNKPIVKKLLTTRTQP